MKGLLFSDNGSFSVETVIVLSFLFIILSTMLSLFLGMFCEIDDLCDDGVSYTGYLPVTIHRVTGVVTETGGEIYAEIS